MTASPEVSPGLQGTAQKAVTPNGKDNSRAAHTFPSNIINSAMPKLEPLAAGTLHDNDSSPPLPPRGPAARLAYRWGQEPGDGASGSGGAGLALEPPGGRRGRPGHHRGLHRLSPAPRPEPGARAPPCSPAAASGNRRGPRARAPAPLAAAAPAARDAKPPVRAAGSAPGPARLSPRMALPALPPTLRLTAFSPLMAQMYIREKPGR
nr:uncharacterized protein LOC110566756 [Meriones unguiculatus]